MDLSEWHLSFVRLTANLETVRNWLPDEPNAEARRCEFSRHRTLAHLRACQEQWLGIALNFIEVDKPSVKVLHPWRKFDNEKYDIESWDSHMDKFIADRIIWLGLEDIVDRNRGGRWNGKVDTVSGLTRRLVDHECHHIATLKHLPT